MVETQAHEAQPIEWLRVKVFHERYPEAGSVNFIYQMAKTGELLSIKLGGKILIRSDALDRLYAEQRKSVGSGKNTTLIATTPTRIGGADAKTS